MPSSVSILINCLRVDLVVTGMRPHELDEYGLVLKIDPGYYAVFIALNVENHAPALDRPSARIGRKHILIGPPRRSSQRAIQLAKCAVRAGMRFSEPEQGVAVED